MVYNFLLDVLKGVWSMRLNASWLEEDVYFFMSLVGVKNFLKNAVLFDRWDFYIFLVYRLGPGYES